MLLWSFLPATARTLKHKYKTQHTLYTHTLHTQNTLQNNCMHNKCRRIKEQIQIQLSAKITTPAFPRQIFALNTTSILKIPYSTHSRTDNLAFCNLFVPRSSFGISCQVILQPASTVRALLLFVARSCSILMGSCCICLLANGHSSCLRFPFFHVRLVTDFQNLNQLTLST